MGDVNVDSETFELILRPFFHVLSGSDRPFGSLTISVSDNTIYNLNGLQFEGSTGLAAMNALTAYTAIVVMGDLRFNPYRFEATEVDAGSNVPGGTLDAVTGNVISREGDTIIVKGATLNRSDGSVVFCDTASVLLDLDTVVKQQLSTDDFSISDISLGQRVTVLGLLTNSNVDSFVLDATGENQGYVRMLLTRLRGTVVGVDAGMTLDLRSINSRQTRIFDFSGTGIDAAHDADPNQYEVSTGTLDLSSIETGEVVKLFGFMNGFGQAPADFLAQTIVDPSRVRSRMRVSLGTTVFHPLSVPDSPNRLFCRRMVMENFITWDMPGALSIWIICPFQSPFQPLSRLTGTISDKISGKPPVPLKLCVLCIRS